MLRHAAEIRLCDFNEVTEDRIVAHLKRFDPGRGDLALLKLADPTLAIAGGISQLIKIDIVAVAENSAVFQSERCVIHQRFAQFLSECRHFLDLVLQTLREQFDFSVVFGARSERQPVEEFLKLDFNLRDLLQRRF